MGNRKNGTATNPETMDLGDILSHHVNNPAGNFAPELEEEPKEEATEFDEPEEIETVETEEIPFSDHSRHADTGQAMEPEDFAAMFINLLDGMQTAFLPGLMEKKKFSEKEAVMLQTLDKNGNYPENTPENALLKKWKNHQKLTKQIPFDEGEKKRLIQSTATYAATTDLKVTPLQGLIMSFGEVVVKRTVLFMSE